MIKDELICQLRRLGVNAADYSLGAICHGECVCVIEEDGKWKVFYVERDRPLELADFCAEEQAYSFVYETFCKWLRDQKV